MTDIIIYMVSLIKCKENILMKKLIEKHFSNSIPILQFITLYYMLYIYDIIDINIWFDSIIMFYNLIVILFSIIIICISYSNIFHSIVYVYQALDQVLFYNIDIIKFLIFNEFTWKIIRHNYIDKVVIYSYNN